MHVFNRYEDMLKAVYEKGKESVHGTHTLTNVVFTAEFSKDAFPINTTRKSYFKTALKEIDGYLYGYNTLELFNSVGVHTWDNNYNNPEWLNSPYRKADGDLGRIYGVQLRQWDGPEGTVDQLNNVLSELTTGKDNRGAIMTMWNPGELHMGCLRPCMHTYNFYIDENGKLCVNAFSRSMDMPLGGNFNVMQVWRVLHFASTVTGLEPGTYSIFVTNAHIYLNQMDLVSVEIQREKFPLPKIIIPEDTETMFNVDLYELEGYQHHEAIKYPFTTTNPVDANGAKVEQDVNS